MHTFFINTSGKELENYSDIFEIQHETRRLVSLECALGDWHDNEKGFKACVRKMGELIDSYKDINNNFNLILYVDLLSYKCYTSIPMNRHRERYACLKALHSILKHYIKCTFIDEMYECGRVPREVLIIFEENQAPKDGDETSEDGKNLIRSFTREILGLPEESEINNIVNNTVTSGEEDASPIRFCDKISDCLCSCIGERVLNTYFDQVDIFISEAKGYDTYEQPVKQMLDRIIDCSDEDDNVVSSVVFATNRRAGIANKQEKTRRNLRLCFYILSCIEDNSIFDKAMLENENVYVAKEFPEIDWESVATELSLRGSVFQKKHSETQSLSESFTAMHLAPPLLAFDSQRFGMDEYGKRGKSFDVVETEEKKDEKDAEQGIVSATNRMNVVVSDSETRSLFTEEEYPAFNYRGDSFNEGLLGKNATPEQYIAGAKKLRQHHLDYLQRLKVHVSDRLSNYAGRSAENEPALLRKRKVSVAEEDFEDAGRDYRYAKTGRVEETKKLKTVKDISETAYTSALLEYMEFCAGRSVAVTDIEEQCNWFVTRIAQIKESLRKLLMVSIGLLIAIFVLYIPFVVIQWEAITKNTLTVTTALLSVVIPVALLFIIFVIATMIQRKKYRKAWKEFKEKSDQILEENAIAAEKYDQLLSIYVPTLRWIYEYKLDVDFYSECCKMARAKIGHHIQKLHDRVVAIGNIIEDLETDVNEIQHSTKKKNTNDDIDYNVSFCSGTTNRKFYSIIDSHFLEMVRK